MNHMDQWALVPMDQWALVPNPKAKQTTQTANSTRHHTQHQAPSTVGSYLVFFLDLFLFFGLASFSLHFPLVFLAFSFLVLCFPSVFVGFPCFSIGFTSCPSFLHCFPSVVLGFPCFSIVLPAFSSLSLSFSSGFRWLSLFFHWFCFVSVFISFIAFSSFLCVCLLLFSFMFSCFLCCPLVLYGFVLHFPHCFVVFTLEFFIGFIVFILVFILVLLHFPQVFLFHWLSYIFRLELHQLWDQSAPVLKF